MVAWGNYIRISGEAASSATEISDSRVIEQAVVVLYHQKQPRV